MGRKNIRCLLVVLATFVLAQGISFGQTVEVCNDGIDNDGNGLIDCADPFCQFAPDVERGCNCFDNIDNDGDGVIDKADPNCASFFGLTFVGQGSNCSITPPGANTPFDLVSAPAAVSGQNTSDTQSKVAVGDIDGDGIPDIAITSKFNSSLRVVATSDNQPDGKDAGDIKSEFNLEGSIILPYSSKFMYEHDVLIADIDKDGKAEIFGIISDRPPQGSSVAAVRFFLVGFRYAINQLIPLFNAIDLGPDRPGIPGIADFDGDGRAEIYLKDEIYAAESGVKLADGGGVWDTDVNAAPVAVNFFPATPNMELVTGKHIYGVPNLASRTLQPLTILADMSTIQPYFPKVYNDITEYGIDNASSTSVADLDEDGFLDVLLSGATTPRVANGPAQTTAVFYWNVQKNKVSVFTPPDPLLPNGWTWGTSRINLGDANGDGRLDASFVAGNRLFCLTTDASDNLIPLWATPRTINDSNSGIVAVTIYDFDNDGNPEMVYRDSREIVIIDGATGQSKLWSATCQSHTFTEGPIIADVNGDGGTDICVPCFRGPGAFNINGTLQEQARGEVRLWFSTGNEWLPTRRVWNQPGYFVVNINDNLTLPFPQLDQMMVFGNTPCPNGIPGPNQPFNVFLNQVPNLSADGCPVFPAPDLTFIGDDPNDPTIDKTDPNYNPAVLVIPPICGDLGLQVIFNVVNSGDLPITDNVPVAFFDGDPQNGGVLLHNDILNIVNLQLGQTIQTSPVTFNGPGTPFRLFIVLYSDGSLPFSIDQTKECSIVNNIFSVDVIPDPFTISIEKVSDNFKCDNTAPDNGELRAHIFKGGVEVFDFSPYAFQWFLGTDTSTPIAGPAGTNFVLADAAENTYTLQVTNVQKGCVSDPVSETIIRLGNDPDIILNVLSDQTLCSPANGQLEAIIVGGSTGFTFEWFDISLNPLGITGPIANNLTAGNYLVRVFKDGCTKISNPVAVDGPQIPDAQAQVLQHVVDCSNLNSGVIQADALFNGVVQDPSLYQFDWFFYDNTTSTRGSILPPANGTGQTRSGLAVGFYQAEIREIATQCISSQFPIVQVTNQTVIPTAVITELAPQTSCDPANANGILFAEASIGGIIQNPADFSFEWFRGDNTLPANLHTTVSGVNGQQADKVTGGGEFYTVKITTANNCFDTEKFIISENINIPQVTLSASPNSICDPLKASSNFNGAVTASVTFGGLAVSDFSNYEFTWHQGQLTSDPVIPVADNKLPALTQLNGGYYTLVVQRLDLFCTSVPVVVEVMDVPVLPSIINLSTPSTNCGGGAPNGILDAQVDIGGGTMTTTGFTFTWYQGNGTTGPVVGNSATVPGMQGGINYTMEVVNNTTGCSNTTSIFLPDNSVLPVLSLTPSSNSICDPLIGFNGSISSSFSDTNGQPGHSYAYVWSTGNDLTNPIGGQTSATLIGQDGGFYTASLTNVTLNCVSSPVTVEILNDQLLPVINTALTPSTHCLGGTPNGAIDTSVDVGGTPTTAGFTFNWFSGDLTTDPAVPASPNNGNTFSPIQLQGGQNYTVEVRNSSSGCINTKTVTLPDNKALPSLTLNASPNSICDPLIGFNGSISSTLTDINGAPGHSYTYLWSVGTDLTNPIAGETAPVLSGRDGNFYTVSVTNITLNCTSPAVTSEIVNNQVFPTITTGITGSSNCIGGAPDGIASVTGVLPLDTYDYRWYQGIAVNPGFELNSIANPTITGLQGGPGENYIVEVTLQSSGCKNTSLVLIPDISEVPLLGPLSKVDNTLCAGSNGEALIGSVDYRGAPVPAPFTGYTLSWSTGANTPTISGLPAGNYSLTIRKDDVNCTSNPVSVDVNDDLFIPVIDVAEIPQTSCVVPRNGELAATVNETSIGGGAGTTAGYTFNWFDGSDLSSPTPGTKLSGTPGEIITLDGNLFYTVETIRTATGCANTRTVFLQEIITIPTVSLNVLSQQTACAPPDGQIEATVVPAPSVNYTFYWLKEQPFQTTNDGAALVTGVNADPVTPNRRFSAAAGATMDVHNQLTFGDYSMVVVDEFTQCISQPVTVPILDQTNSNITFGIGALPTSCALSNGSINVQAARNDGAPTFFTFEIFIEGPTNPVSPINFTDNPPVFDPVLNPPSGTTSPFPTLGPVASNTNINQGGLFSSTYSVIATDALGCKNFNTFFLPFQDAHDVDVVALNSQICPYTIGDGSISLQTIPPPTTLGANQTQFTYSFYAGGVADPANLLSPPPANPFNYPLSTEICNDGFDNDGDGLADGADPDCTNRVDKLNLAPGFYTIEVQENISGAFCKVKKIIEIGRDALPPVVDLVSFTPNTACDILGSPDGSSEIKIEKDADDNTVGSTYTLAVSPLTGTETFVSALGTLPFPNPVITGLKPDSSVPQYTITVTSSNNCSSSRFVSIPNQPTTAELLGSDVLVRDAEYCNPLLEQSARIVVNNIRLEGGGVEDISDYQFDWFTDIGLTTNVFPAAQGDPGAIAGGDEFINDVPLGSGTVPAGTVAAGSYWVKVTKTADASGTGGIGCISAPFKVDILDHTVNPQVVLTPFSNTACDGNFEGRIVVDAVTPVVFAPPNLSPGNGATYGYNWFSSVTPPSNTTGETGIGNSTPSDLQDGNYTLVATNEVTGCTGSAFTTILKVSPPVFTLNVTSTPQQLCSPDGTATVNDVLLNGVSDGIANFDFNWFRGSSATPPLLDGTSTTIVSNQINNANYLPIGEDTYFVVAIRRPNTDPGSGCLSTIAQVKIQDVSVDPLLSLTPFFNTACDTGFEGRIVTLATTQPGTPGELATYNYVWSSTSSTTPASNPVAVGNETFINLEDGDYTLAITNNITQCQTQANTSILKSLTPIVVASATPADQQLCTPDGSILVNDVTVNGLIDPDHNNFDFLWHKDSPANPPLATGFNNDFFDIVDFPNIGAGTYYVKAIRRNGIVPGSGCESAPLRVEIKDVSVDPVISFSTVANTSCDVNFDGQITVLTSTASGPGSAANYDLMWTAVPAGSVVADAIDTPSPYSTGAGDVVGPGTFSVQATNRITQCLANASTILLNNPQPLEVLAVNKTDQLICFPDGSISVTALNSGSVANYTYQWFRNDPTTPPLQDGAAIPISTPTLNVGNFPSISAGTYYVVATKNSGVAPGSGCQTPAFRVDLQDMHQDPRIQFMFTPNSSCDLLNPNGSVQADALEQNGVNTDTYSFAWTFNGGAMPGVTAQTDNSNSSLLDPAFEGNYALTIVNTTTTGCQFTAGINVNLDLSVSLPNIIDALTVDPLDCLASGEARVTRVGIGGINFFNDPPDDLDLNFDYKWFKDNLGNQLPGEVNHSILNVLPGTYFVTVLDGATKCESGPKEVVIKDDQIIFPVVQIVQTAKQISCLSSSGTAALASTADGQTDANPNYLFNWFTSLDASGISFATTSTITDQLAGNYSVSALNTITGCSSFALYIVPDEAPQFTPVISVGGQPRTLCVGQDGSVLARVIDISPTYPFPLNFTSDLFFGAQPNPAGAPDIANMALVPGFSTNFVEPGLAEGLYTVRITDNNTGCVASKVTEVLDQRMLPTIAIVQDNPLTHCDPAIANGQLSATADGGKVGGFDFAWFSGMTISSPPGTSLSQINKLIGRGAGDYVVRVTNKITGCFADLAGLIEDKTILPPVPLALTLQNRTNCIAPNGIVSASVGGEILGFAFNWFDGLTVSGSADFIGAEYRNLDIGDYTVTATDQVTGCVSPPATTPVLDERLIPEFIFETTPSFCKDTGLPIGNGSIALILTNTEGTNISLSDVQWFDTVTDQPIGIGSDLYEIYPGFYRAEAITNEGCTNEGIAEVKTEINPYNGVSTNNDGRNDVFIVDCISLFPNNNVKIFNRSGIKVYEADGYDNANVAFGGTGLNGLYLGGKELPVGTYFYVIDKRDGSKPIAGFLELDR